MSVIELEERIKKLEEEVRELKRLLYEHLRHHGLVPPVGPDRPRGPPDVPEPMNRPDQEVGEPWRV